MKKVRVALAQLNQVVGDINGNTKKIIAAIKKAAKKKADIVVFPELAVTGYPPEDLLLKPHFIRDNINALKKIEAAAEGVTAVVGFVDENNGLHNAAAVISNNRTAGVYYKKHLPNYGVFDECRYFNAGNKYSVYDAGSVCFGINICEDIWMENGPAKVQALSGAGLILNLNASPYHMGKALLREEYISKLAADCKTAIVYVNMVGGQDELVFDGGSFAVDAGGNILAKAKQFHEDLVIVDIDAVRPKVSAGDRALLKKNITGSEITEKVKVPAITFVDKPSIRTGRAKQLSQEEEVYSALVLGTGDYVLKNGFRGVIIGLSGGIDSALTATIAVDALGRENVRGLFMPSKYTSSESREDAYLHAENLGIEISTISIDSMFRSYLKILSEHFSGLEPDTTEENLQARIRGNLLMAFSNKFGSLVLTTGNKSEMSVGYATLYGDMAGGFAVIKDVPKTLVYKLAEWRNVNAGHDLIPERIIWKEPTAELRPDQRDIDSLPPYPLLDPILKAYVEDELSFEEILKMGCDYECTSRVIAMVDRAEYKRRQAPPGIKITPRAFGKDRRFPVTNRYKDY